MEFASPFRSKLAKGPLNVHDSVWIYKKSLESSIAYYMRMSVHENLTAYR